jgi:hypothetical protein
MDKDRTKNFATRVTEKLNDSVIDQSKLKFGNTRCTNTSQDFDNQEKEDKILSEIHDLETLE